MNQEARRAAVLQSLCKRRHWDVQSMAREFSVSERTIRRDLLELSCSYPIETVRGRFGGGVKVADWYRLDRKTLASEQRALLIKLAQGLSGEELKTMNSIISQFSTAV